MSARRRRDGKNTPPFLQTTRRGDDMETLTEPAKIIAIMRVMLTELERTLSTAPEPTNESNHTGELQTRIDRLDAVLKKRQAADRRRKELDRQNRVNTRPAKSR